MVRFKIEYNDGENRTGLEIEVSEYRGVYKISDGETIEIHCSGDRFLEDGTSKNWRDTFVVIRDYKEKILKIAFKKAPKSLTFSTNGIYKDGFAVTGAS